MQTRENDERQTLTVAEAARRLGVSRASAYNAARNGTLPSVKFGGRVLVPRRALDRLLDQGANGSHEQPAAGR